MELSQKRPDRWIEKSCIVFSTPPQNARNARNARTPGIEVETNTHPVSPQVQRGS
jgi:hypothetical protein